MPNLLERVEELHRRVTELEQRVPKPIPVVEPLAIPTLQDWFEGSDLLSARAEAAAYNEGIEEARAWKDRAERAEGKLSDAHGLAVELRYAFASGRDVDSLHLAHNLVDFLARARVAKSVP